MDGKGHWMDNIMIERLWRSLKYECITSMPLRREANSGKVSGYNTRCPHSSLDDKTPDEAYWQKPRPGYAGPEIKLAA